MLDKKRTFLIFSLLLFIITGCNSYSSPPPPRFKLSTEIGGFDLTKKNLTKFGIPFESIIYVDREYLAWKPIHNEQATIIWQGAFADSKFGESEYYFKINEHTKALELLKASADENDPSALLTLGLKHVTGEYLEKDYKKAKEYYEKAAELNQPLANTNIAALYEQGLGVEQNAEKAYQYYLKNKNDTMESGICNAYRLIEFNLVNKSNETKELLLQEARNMDLDCLSFINLFKIK